MDASRGKPIALNMRISERTKGQLTELQRVLSQKAGTRLTLTQTVEAAIDKTLGSFAANPDQARLI